MTIQKQKIICNIEEKDCILFNRFLYLSNKYQLLYRSSKTLNASNELKQYYLKQYLLNRNFLLYTFSFLKEKYNLPDYPISDFEFNISLLKVCYNPK